MRRRVGGAGLARHEAGQTEGRAHTARLFEADPATLALSEVLVTGPESTGGTAAGLSGITGPLTECVTTLPPPG